MLTSIYPSLRIVTRKSPLALWQANHVKKALEAAHPKLQIEVIGMMTEGDKLLATPLAEIGGKGLFVKELERTILERRADIAVHSIKDMPVTLCDGLILGAICEREDPRDAFISPHFASLTDLPEGATVGTSSSRRACQIKALRPDLRVEPLRGNVGTRLMRLDEGKFDAIILAAAGLKRLNEENRITSYLAPELWIPAVGQGAIGIECHQDNQSVLQWIAALEHFPTRICITAERAMNHALDGGCQLPIAAYASYSLVESLTVRGMVGDLSNNQLLTAVVTGDPGDAELLGRRLAQELRNQGADSILAKLHAYRSFF
jgi:hydroxymethylbilane synthase